MFEFIGDIVGGGWDAVSNVVTGIGKGVSDFGSGFFPQPQRDKVVSEIVAPVNTGGISYRDITPDAKSISETAAWAENFWLDSPYEAQYSPTFMRAEGSQLDQAVSMTQSKTWADNLVDFFSGVKETAAGVFSEAGKFKTVFDDFRDIFGASRRETVTGTPRAGYPEGRDETYYNQDQPGGADVVTAYGRAFFDQIKGLFSLGYKSPQGAQPASSIPTADGGLSAITIVIGIALIAGVIFLSKRK